MVERVTLEPAFILHRTVYRETSVLLDCFTEKYGRFRAIAKGVRTAKSSLKGTLQAFQPLSLSWQTRSQTGLSLLTHAESINVYPTLVGRHLLVGLYVNELLIRLLHSHDAHPLVYTQYEKTLQILVNHADIEPALRQFELTLLSALGYGINFEHEADGISAILPEQYYHWMPEQGFVRMQSFASPQPSYLGSDLQAIGQAQFDNANILSTAKQLVRDILPSLLGHKPLQTRLLF